MSDVRYCPRLAEEWFELQEEDVHEQQWRSFEQRMDAYEKENKNRLCELDCKLDHQLTSKSLKEMQECLYFEKYLISLRRDFSQKRSKVS